MNCKFCNTPHVQRNGEDYCCDECGATFSFIIWTKPVISTETRRVAAKEDDPEMERLRTMRIAGGAIDCYSAIVDFDHLRRKYDGVFGDDYEKLSRQIDAFKDKYPQIYGRRG